MLLHFITIGVVVPIRRFMSVASFIKIACASKKEVLCVADIEPASQGDTLRINVLNGRKDFVGVHERIRTFGPRIHPTAIFIATSPV